MSFHVVTTAKLANLAQIPKDDGFAVTATTPAGDRNVSAVVLPGRTPETVALHFLVPAPKNVGWCYERLFALYDSEKSTLVVTARDADLW